MPYVLGNHSSAGVYVREFNFAKRPQGIATTGGGTVGYSNKGVVGFPYTCLTVEDFIEEFGKPHPSQGYMHYTALPFLESGAPLTVVRVDTHALTAGAYCTVDDPDADAPIISLDNFNDSNGYPLGVYDPINTLGFIESDPGIENMLFYVCASNPGEWNTQLQIRVFPKTVLGYETTGEFSDPSVFNIEVYLNFNGPSSYPSESFVVSREIKTDGFGNSLFIEDVINKRSKLIRVKNNPFSSPTIPIRTSSFVFLKGSDNGNPVTMQNIADGWNLLLDKEAIDARILMNAGYTDTYIHHLMTDIAKNRQDAFAILDMPSSEQQATDAINYRFQTLNIDSSYSGLFTPDVLIDDPYNGMTLYVPMSGYIGGLMAANESKYGVAKASAGVLNGKLSVRGLRHLYNQSQRDALTTANINMARSLPPTSGYSGFVLWNSCTLSITPSPEQEITVRRLMNQIELVLSTAFKRYVFSPNNLTLRRELIVLASDYLDIHKANGDFAEYAIQCDDANNPSHITANGDLIFSVAIDAESAVPAKRILIRSVINRTGVTSTAF